MTKLAYKSNLRMQQGFSLVELAVVLVILGFVIGALMMPLQAQRENTLRLQTENQLEIAKRALIGFAQTKGRLPCPATANGTGVFPDDSGVSNEDANEVCAQQWGFLPAATLGIQPADSAGFAIDGWGNRIFYAVTQTDADADGKSDVTTTGGMAKVGIVLLNQNLRVCSIASTSTSTCPLVGGNETNYLINNAVAVIYSTGATAGLGIGGDDENENLNAEAGVDTVFVSRGISGSNHPGGEFDHMVVWVSPYVLYNAMIQAGQLH